MDADIFKKIDNSRNFYKGEDIIPKDDAFHGNINIMDVEWWYFDAVFDNGYSIHIGIRLYHLKNSGILESRINIYKDGNVETETIKRDFYNSFKPSNDFPDLIINGKQVVGFDKEHYKKNDEWKYNVDLQIDNINVNLYFLGTTKGWKIETEETCWAVALPKAIVKGKINFLNKQISVKGIGYHDHNWGYSPSTMFKNIGWFWGRVTGDFLNLTWANTIQNKKKGDLLAVINQDRKTKTSSNKYFSINPKNIEFTPRNFKKVNRKLIPTEFDLIIDSNSESELPIYAEIHMKSIFIQHSKIFTAHYWRYHVKSTGKIEIDSKIDKLDKKNQIMEFLLFKT